MHIGRRSLVASFLAALMGCVALAAVFGAPAGAQVYPPNGCSLALSVSAAYLVRSLEEPREPMDWTPESSRRARGFAVYAALRQLGRSGVEDMIDRCCALARRFADRLRAEPRIAILNEVVLPAVS